MNSILILLGCRNRPKEAYPTEQLVEDIEEFEDELQFDRKFHETLIVVRGKFHLVLVSEIRLLICRGETNVGFNSRNGEHRR